MAVVEGKAKVTLDSSEAGVQIEKLEKQSRELRAEIVKLRKEPLVDQKKVKSLETQLKGVKNETKQIREQTISYKKVLDNLSGASLNQLNSAYRKLNKEVKTLDRNTKGYKKKAADLAKLKTEINKVKKEMRGAGTASKGFGASLKNIGSQLFGSVGLIGGIYAFFSVLKSALGVMMDFSKASSNLQAIMGLTKDEMSVLTEQAKELGSTTAFTASEVLALQTELAKLGFDRTEITASTEAVLNLAAATGSELAPAAELAGATLRIFNLDAAEMSRVSDVLAKSTTVSSLSMEKLATILPTVGKTAQIAGVSLERTAALAGTLTDRGLDASSAGTSLRNIFLELSNKGITWNDAMEKINKSSDKNKTAMDLFGKRAAAAGVILSETADDTDKLTYSLESATGAANEMADVMLDNLSGDITIATSAWEGFILSMSDGEGVLSDALRYLVNSFTDLLTTLRLFNEGDFNKFMKSASNTVIDFADIITFGAFSKVSDQLDETFGIDVNGFKFNMEKAAKSTEKLTGETTKLEEKNKDILKSEKELEKERKKNAKLAEENAKKIQKAKDDEIKANQSLADQIELMNTQAIQDANLRAQEELRIWHDKELRKIADSKASTESKALAVEALEQLHKQKLLKIESDFTANIEAEAQKQVDLVEKQIQQKDEAFAAAFNKWLADEEAHEQAKFDIREHYGLVRLDELRTLELDALQVSRDEGLLTEREFQEAKFKIKMNYAAKWVGAQAQHFNVLSDIFATQKENELAIAGDNEEAKKAIMKKYADKEFAVKVAQIGASTAQAIMQAFAQLGPVGGAVAAALLTVKGIVEVGKANTERQKVKGLASGGSIQVSREQDGRNFNASYDPTKRGFVHKPTVLVGEEGTEFVVSNKSLQIPQVKNFVSAVDSFQKGGGLKYFNYKRAIGGANTVRGFADGGYTNTPSSTTANGNDALQASVMLIDEFRAFRAEIHEWQKQLKAYVVYEDIENAAEEINLVKTNVTI